MFYAFSSMFEAMDVIKNKIFIELEERSINGVLKWDCRVEIEVSNDSMNLLNMLLFTQLQKHLKMIDHRSRRKCS